MKQIKSPFFFLTLSLLIIVSCKNNTSKNVDSVPIDTATAADTAPTNYLPDAIVIDTAISKDGTMLIATFYNTKGTVSLLFNKDTIELKQDTMASGIRYSNANYIYASWHGESTLEKNGKKIFESKKH